MRRPRAIAEQSQAVLSRKQTAQIRTAVKFLSAPLPVSGCYASANCRGTRKACPAVCGKRATPLGEVNRKGDTGGTDQAAGC
jgi:hypothetical protein